MHRGIQEISSTPLSTESENEVISPSCINFLNAVQRDAKGDAAKSGTRYSESESGAIPSFVSISNVNLQDAKNAMKSGDFQTIVLHVCIAGCIVALISLL